MTTLAPHLTAFLGERLAIARAASSHTCDTYAYAFLLLLEFASKKPAAVEGYMLLRDWDAANAVAWSV